MPKKSKGKLDLYKKIDAPKKMYMSLLDDPDRSMRFCGLFGALETEYLFTFVNQLKFVCRQFYQISQSVLAIRFSGN